MLTFDLFSMPYVEVMKQHPPFVLGEVGSESKEEEEDWHIPSELMCPLCKDLVAEAIIMPCCGNSYCKQCECFVAS